MKDYKIDVITKNIAARREEIAGYEINIFNYEYMRGKAADEAMQKSLDAGIAENIREMNKIKMVLEALEAQLVSLASF